METRVLAFGIGLMCLWICPLGLILFNYMYFFQPERHGPNIISDMIILNILCLFGILMGINLVKRFKK